MISVREEAEMVKDYLELQKLRYGDSLHYVLNVDPEIQGTFILKMVLQPLVENSVNHGIRPKETPGVVYVEGTAEDGYLKFTIEDDGVGMDEDKIKELNRENISSNEKSFGLRGTIERMRIFYESDIDYTIQSTKGKGTTIVLRVPVMKEMKVMMKVLLVEDEVGTRNLLRIIVNWEEFHMKIIGEAQNGREALFRIQEEIPDLVVTDIKMPIMDGISLAEEIMKKYPQVKVIIVTAYDDFKYAQKALRAGAVDFILKPLKRQEVKEALARVGRQIETVEEGTKEVMEQIRDYLEENYAQSSLSLSTTAERFYLNPSYLSRTFRKKTGIPFVEYLNKVRIEHACDYLKSGNWKVYEIAEKVGIPNPDYFSRCFRKYMGMSVNDYKKSKICAE